MAAGPRSTRWQWRFRTTQPVASSAQPLGQNPGRQFAPPKRLASAQFPVPPGRPLPALRSAGFARRLARRCAALRSALWSEPAPGYCPGRPFARAGARRFAQSSAPRVDCSPAKRRVPGPPGLAWRPTAHWTVPQVGPCSAPRPGRTTRPAYWPWRWPASVRCPWPGPAGASRR